MAKGKTGSLTNRNPAPKVVKKPTGKVGAMKPPTKATPTPSKGRSGSRSK